MSIKEEITQVDLQLLRRAMFKEVISLNYCIRELFSDDDVRQAIKYKDFILLMQAYDLLDILVDHVKGE